MIKLSFLNLFRRKTRTFLSVAGIAIGVAAIIVLVSLVDGFTQDFNGIVGQFKAISVVEKDAQDQTLSHIDSAFGQKLESLPYVKTVVPEIFLLPQKIDGQVLSLSTSAASVYGLDTSKFLSTSEIAWIGEVEKGSELRASDTGHVLLGKAIAEGNQKFVGSTIKINEKTFKVKGILKTESDLLGGLIVMNLSDARDLSGFPSGKVSSFTVLLTEPDKDEIVAKLIELKYETELTALTQKDLSQQLGGITDSLRLLAIVVALISSIVAGIGIANTILMSIFERFREIGALKAVGWTNSNVVRMVLYEAAFLGVFGGVIGILMGFAIDGVIASSFGLKYVVSPVLLFGSFGFAVFLGVISGVYPAFVASRLDPVEALRG